MCGSGGTEVGDTPAIAPATKLYANGRAKKTPVSSPAAIGYEEAKHKRFLCSVAMT